MELSDRIAGLMPQAKRDLSELVSYRSVADPRQFPAEECAKAAEWVLAKFSQIGFAGQLVTTSDGSKAVYGERKGPAGARTVLLYAHYDVQPPLGDDLWQTPPFELTERNGRWYGRGAADCKGNIIMNLVALRALAKDIPLNLKLIVEGAEEQSSEGLEDFVRNAGDMLSADAILVCDTGGAAVGRPAATISLRGNADIIVTVDALGSNLHSGVFGGAAPDALAALIRMLGTLRDRQGNTTIAGLDNTRTWPGEKYPGAQFRADAQMLEGTQLLGEGSVADMIWARLTATVVGIDCPPVVGAPSAIQSRARARINLRVPPGVDPARAQDALVAQLHDSAPWGVQVSIERTVPDNPFLAETGGPAYRTLAAAMHEAYGEEMATLGLGGSIPLCNTFSAAFPRAEIILIGVEEPRAQIHAPNESVDPNEIANMALAEAIFLQRYAAMA
ncbi:MAG TPA: dipeptidase [Streptosporangiaceae bacterium]|nr:dipeptidase [Streptosporangiaceae bacterium]